MGCMPCWVIPIPVPSTLDLQMVLELSPVQRISHCPDISILTGDFLSSTLIISSRPALLTNYRSARASNLAAVGTAQPTPCLGTGKLTSSKRPRPAFLYL